jgi:hypothetical protein
MREKGDEEFFVCTFNFPSGANLCLCIKVIFLMFIVPKKHIPAASIN